MITAIVIGAGERGARAYAPYALNHPDELRIVGVADPDARRHEGLAEAHGVDAAMRFTTWQEVHAGTRRADAVFICTQDSDHFAPAMAFMEAGYEILLEKPMSNDPAECLRLGEEARRRNRTLVIAHVLRYTDFFQKIKSIIASGRIGRVATIQLTEAITYWHMAHSYVRGNWRNADMSSPLILAKCCHDMDILLWLADGRCTSLSSYGSLLHFRPENAPAGAAERCLDNCAAADTCPFYAPDIYLRDTSRWPTTVVSADPSPEAVRRALEVGPYGRCVYCCDNTVVDHQVVNLAFDNEVTASFVFTGFAAEESRSIRITGTAGEIRGHLARGEIEIRRFDSPPEIMPRLRDGAGHGGGDEGIVRDFVRVLEAGRASVGPGVDAGADSDMGAGATPAGSPTSAEVSVESHLMAFAAEESRLTGRTVEIQEFRRSCLSRPESGLRSTASA